VGDGTVDVVRNVSELGHGMSLWFEKMRQCRQGSWMQQAPKFELIVQNSEQSMHG
jgi:hypothetical protein